MKVDVNKPVELVTYDCGHVIDNQDAEIIHLDGSAAMLKTQRGSYVLADVKDGTVISLPFHGLRNKKVKTTTKSVFDEVIPQYLSNTGWTAQDLWDELLEKGIVEDKEIEV